MQNTDRDRTFVRHVPHSPSFRSFRGLPQQPPPPPVQSHACSPIQSDLGNQLANQRDLQRMRRPELVRSWSSQSLPAVPQSPMAEFALPRQAQSFPQHSYRQYAVSPVRAHAEQPRQHPRRTESDRHVRHASIDSSVSTSSSSSTQLDRIERYVVMDRSKAETMIQTNEITVSSAIDVVDKVAEKKEKSRFKKALSFIAPPEEDVLEYNFGNNSIYENRKKKSDDSSITSTASSVSKAFKRFPRIFKNDDRAEKPAEPKPKPAPEPARVEPARVAPGQVKSILKKVRPDEELPPLTRESSLVSHSSSSSTSLANMHRRRPSSISPATVKFSPHIEIYNTYPAGEYDRKIPGPAVPLSTYPMWMIAQIKEELNAYKKMEMEVHEESHANTCYY